MAFPQHNSLRKRKKNKAFCLSSIVQVEQTITWQYITQRKSGLILQGGDSTLEKLGSAILPIEFLTGKRCVSYPLKDETFSPQACLLLFQVNVDGF